MTESTQHQQVCQSAHPTNTSVPKSAFLSNRLNLIFNCYNPQHTHEFMFVTHYNETVTAHCSLKQELYFEGSWKRPGPQGPVGNKSSITNTHVHYLPQTSHMTQMHVFNNKLVVFGCCYKAPEDVFYRRIVSNPAFTLKSDLFGPHQKVSQTGRDLTTAAEHWTFTFLINSAGLECSTDFTLKVRIW